MIDEREYLDAPPSVLLEGMEIHAITEQQCVQRVLQGIEAGRGGWVFTPNIDHLQRYQIDMEFHRAVETATLTVADGMPLLWACALRGEPLPERVCGSNLICSVSDGAASDGRSVFLYGGHPGTEIQAADKLQQMYPGLKVAGTYCPEFAPAEALVADSDLHSLLTETRPDIVFIGLSSPKQDLVIRDLRKLFPEIWWLGVGASFSFLAEHLNRAPRWMQKTGLEWLHRLPQDPGRLGRRYILNNFPYCLGMFRRAIRDRRK